jgi:hypothetical protein
MVRRREDTEYEKHVRAVIEGLVAPNRYHDKICCLIDRRLHVLIKDYAQQNGMKIGALIEKFCKEGMKHRLDKGYYGRIAETIDTPVRNVGTTEESL